MRGLDFYGLQKSLIANWPAPFVDCVFLLNQILSGAASGSTVRRSKEYFASIALEKMALRGQLRRPHVPQAEILVTHFPPAENYAGFLAPVASELKRRGHSVAVALPPGKNALKEVYGTVPTFFLDSLATPSAYVRARVAYRELLPFERAFSRRCSMNRGEIARLRLTLQAYCWQRELMRMALTSTGARVVYGLHFMINAGLRGAIRAPGPTSRAPRTVLMQHGVFVGDWPTHDFHGADRVLLWADEWQEELNRFPFPVPESSVTGNPKLESLLDASSSDSRGGDRAGDPARLVLVLGTNGEPVRDGLALRLTANALPESHLTHVKFRPHPAEPEENYLSLVREGLLRPHQIDSSQDAYAAIRSADVVLGTQSTLLIEAVLLGVPAVQVLPDLFEVDWAERGMPSASNEADLATLVTNLLSDERLRRRTLDTSVPLAESIFGRVQGSARRAADAVEAELDVAESFAPRLGVDSAPAARKATRSSSVGV